MCFSRTRSPLVVNKDMGCGSVYSTVARVQETVPQAACGYCSVRLDLVVYVGRVVQMCHKEDLSRMW